MKSPRSKLPVLFLAFSLGLTVSTTTQAGLVDTVLKSVARLSARINEYILIYGDRAKAIAKYARTLMKLNADKQAVSTEGYIKALLESRKLASQLGFDFGPGDHELFIDGKTVKDGSLAPGACLAYKYKQWKKERDKQRAEQAEAITKNTSKLVLSTLGESQTKVMNTMYNTLVQSSLPVNMSPTVVVPDNEETRKAIQAQAAVMVYRKPVVDLKSIDEEELEDRLAGKTGVRNVLYGMLGAIMSDALTERQLRTVDAGDGKTDETQKIKDETYLNSAKRVYSEHAKSEKGVLMERNALLVRQFNSEMRKFKQLQRQRRLLMAVAMRRISDLGEDL